MSETPSTDPRATAAGVRPEAVVPEEDREQPVVRDKRRIDPVTGKLREPSPATPAGAVPPPAGTAPDESADSAAPAAADDSDPRVDELTEQLQRITAEYANYRRRKEREQAELASRVTGDVLGRLVSVLDDVERARVHGDLEGAFKTVGEALEKVTSSLGLVPYAEKGEPFDPTLHDALLSQPSPDATEPVIAEVFARGFRVGDRVLRAAQVVVAEPA